MESIQCGIPLDELGKHFDQPIPNAGTTCVEINAAGPHAVPLTIRIGQFQIRILENRATKTIDEDRIRPQLFEDRRLGVRAERKNIDPTMNSYPGAMGALKKQTKSVFTIFRDQAPVGRSVRLFGFVPGSAAAIDLNKEIGGPERKCFVDELLGFAGIFEDPLTALGQHPEPSHAGRRGDREAWGLTGGRIGNGLDEARRRILRGDLLRGAPRRPVHLAACEHENAGPARAPLTPTRKHDEKIPPGRET